MKNKTKQTGFSLQIRIYYEDTDAGGIVYHSRYLNFMERARTEWLRHLGFEQDRLIQQQGILFAVCKVDIEYNRPAIFNQLLNINTRIMHKRSASLVFAQIISNQSEETICQAEIKVACINSTTMQPKPIPKIILSEIH